MRAALLLALATAVPAAAQDDVQARMRGWAAALGVACTHCHVDGAWADPSKPVFEFAGRMRNMVRALNDGPLKGVEPITCWTCHRGNTRPARLPVAAWQQIRDRHVGEFTSPELALAMSVYAASLGVDCAGPSAWSRGCRRSSTRSPSTSMRREDRSRSASCAIRAARCPNVRRAEPGLTAGGQQPPHANVRSAAGADADCRR